MKEICPICKNCSRMMTDDYGKWFWCDFDHTWVSYENAINSDLECEAYVEELDDYETEESSA